MKADRKPTWVACGRDHYAWEIQGRRGKAKVELEMPRSGSDDWCGCGFAPQIEVKLNLEKRLVDGMMSVIPPWNRGGA